MLKVGVFDSGLGGLTVVQAMMKELKGAKIYYVADSKNAPYGNKKPQKILDYSLKITDYFVKTYKIDALILACNTATAYAIERLRALYPNLIIIGTEPAIKPAIRLSKTGQIGVLATPATLQGEKYQTLAKRVCKEKEVKIYEQACKGLVEQIEQGELSTDKTKALLEVWLRPMNENSVDIIVLGCTHYPLISELIEEIMLKKVTLLHTAEAISKHLLFLSREKGYPSKGSLELKIEVTGEIKSKIVEMILSKEVTIVSIEI